MIKIALAVSLLAGMTGLAFAGTGNGKVVHISPLPGDVVIFATQIHSSKPACSTAGNDWTIKLDTETGRATYALLLSAASLNKPITVYGTNDCRHWGDREAVERIVVGY
jgi:hypothetical protein